jgi:hypothetical protein|tara:strand:- start:1297 stop:1722 length:426 start_codon:yes stop_codon:yes gene_type:complete
MKKINSRTKGAAFERLMVKTINDRLEQEKYETRVKRNLDQAFVKGLADIYLDNFAIECKRYGASNTNMYKQAWWDQVIHSAGDRFIPILIYKFNFKEIYAVIPAWLVSSAPKNNQITYMCPLDELCKQFDEIMAKGHVHSK